MSCFPTRMLPRASSTHWTKRAGVWTGPQGPLPVYVFFDAQCPYCHKLFADMEGVIPAKWLPTLALGDGGIPLVTHIMGEVSTVQDKSGGVQSVVLADDPGRAARLKSVVGDSERPTIEPGADLSPAIAFLTRENETLMRYLYGKQADLAGVPAILVALPDGSARMLHGYEPSTVEQIRNLQSPKAQ